MNKQERKYYHWDEVVDLVAGDKIVLAPDPDEGFTKEETVEFVARDLIHYVIMVSSPEHGIFEVGMEQFSRKVTK